MKKRKVLGVLLLFIVMVLAITSCNKEEKKSKADTTAVSEMVEPVETEPVAPLEEVFEPKTVEELWEKVDEMMEGSLSCEYDQSLMVKYTYEDAEYLVESEGKIIEVGRHSDDYYYYSVVSMAFVCEAYDYRETSTIVSAYIDGVAACGIETASAAPNKTKVAKLTKEQVQKIAETKMPDLNAASLEAAMSMIAGTARSMGITVEE